MNPSPADLARWAFWVPLRNTLDPTRPAPIHALRHAWTLQWRTAGSSRQLMADEYRRWFGTTLTDHGIEGLIQAAYRSAWRVHLEELLLGKLSEGTIDDWVEFRNLDRLESALSHGKGVVWVYPHAGPIMLMLAGLAYKGFTYTQYAARGLPPEALATEHPELLATNRWRARVRAVREASEDTLPVEFLTLDTPVRSLHRRLDDGGIVGLAFDGRIGSGWWPADYLGRTALLSAGPWKLATATGAMVVPAFCHAPQDGPATVEIGTPLEPGSDWRTLATEALATEQQWLRQHPEEYGLWLLHTRQRCTIDDHPMFIDQAQDDRWRRWMKDEIDASG